MYVCMCVHCAGRKLEVWSGVDGIFDIWRQNGELNERVGCGMENMVTQDLSYLFMV